MNVKAGQRVRITGIMPEEPAPLAVGEEGTVITDGPNSSDQILVRWDSGRSLILLTIDPFVVL